MDEINQSWDLRNDPVMASYLKRKKQIKLPDRKKIYNFMKKFDALKNDQDEENDFDFVTDIKNTLNLSSCVTNDNPNLKKNPKIKFGIFTRSKF
jgi:hypothetical protein